MHYFKKRRRKYCLSNRKLVGWKKEVVKMGGNSAQLCKIVLLCRCLSYYLLSFLMSWNNPFGEWLYDYKGSNNKSNLNYENNWVYLVINLYVKLSFDSSMKLSQLDD